MQNEIRNAIRVATAPTEAATATKIQQPTEILVSQSVPLEVRLQPISASIVLQEDKPLHLHVDTPSDWPSVFATLVVGVAVAYLAYAGQRNQIRSSTANFRAQWQAQLRDLIAEFIAIASGRLIAQIAAESSKSDIEGDYRRLVAIHATVLLMLDKKKPYTDKIRNAMEKVIENIAKGQEGVITEKFEELLNQTNEVLEQAWNQIKADLRGQKKP